MSRPADLDPYADPFHPPTVPTLVHCLHCDEEYDSYLIEWRVAHVHGETCGFWCCPTPGCDGKGFGFDIFPVDPDYLDENGEPMGFEEDSGAELEPGPDDEGDWLDQAILEAWELADEDAGAAEDDRTIEDGFHIDLPPRGGWMDGTWPEGTEPPR